VRYANPDKESVTDDNNCAVSPTPLILQFSGNGQPGTGIGPAVRQQDLVQALCTLQAGEEPDFGQGHGGKTVSAYIFGLHWN
jgi:hypothetical protein